MENGSRVEMVDTNDASVANTLHAGGASADGEAVVPKYEAKSVCVCECSCVLKCVHMC